MHTFQCLRNYVAGANCLDLDLKKYISYGKLVTYMNDEKSIKSVRQIRQTDNPRSIIWVTRKHSLIISLR